MQVAWGKVKYIYTILTKNVRNYIEFVHRKDKIDRRFPYLIYLNVQKNGTGLHRKDKNDS
jgi:hypothetical protein